MNPSNPKTPRAVLFKSQERFSAFLAKLNESGVDCTILDFENDEWITFDYSGIDFIIYYPSFEYSSNHPLALQKVHDNLMFISSEYPNLKFFPDPKIIKYYNDKYRQFLFLKKHDFPIPETIPLFSAESANLADKRLGYPMVVKNRYGAGGGSVFKVNSRKELEQLYKISRLDLFSFGAMRYFWNLMSQRIFYYHLIKARRMNYPFFSPPLLAQKYITTDRDLKTVVGNFMVVEGHWRFQASADQWKVNIDGGGIGQWSHIPQDAIDISERLARELKASWINLDLMPHEDGFLITEFSPVWHHYRFREKASFVYKDDYNIEPALEVSLDLEKIVVESLIARIDVKRAE